MALKKTICLVFVFFLMCRNINGQARTQNITPCESCLTACKEGSRPNASPASKTIGLMICDTCIHNTTVCPVQELSRILYKYWKTEDRTDHLDPYEEKITARSTRQPLIPRTSGNTEKPCSNKLTLDLLRKALRNLGQCQKNLSKAEPIVEKYQENLIVNELIDRFVGANNSQINLPGINENYASNEPSIRVLAGTELCPSTMQADFPTYGIHRSGRQVEILQTPKRQIFYTRQCSSTQPLSPIGKRARCQTVKNWHIALIKVPNHEYDSNIFKTCKSYGNIYKCLDWVGLDGHCSLIQYSS